MASSKTTNIFFAAVMIVFFAAAVVSAQDLVPSPSPAQMDAGAAFSLPVSGAVVGASLFFSLLALLKH